LVVALCCASSAAATTVEPFVRRDKFEHLKLSPTGEYYAATVPLGDRTALAIVRRSDNKLTGTFGMGRNTRVEDFVWVNSTRVLISLAEKFGSLDSPQLTGELYAVNADGSHADILVGQRVNGAGLGTKIQPKKVEQVAAFLIDDLAKDDKNVLISVMPFSSDPYTRVDRMDVYTGRRVQVARAPVRNAEFVTDNNGVVRFAVGSGTDSVRKVYYRDGEGADWTLISEDSITARSEWPIGFSADNKIAYLQAEQPKGPDAILALDLATMKRSEVLSDDDTDPGRIIYRNGTQIPVGAFFMDGRPRSSFFDASSPEAKLQKGLEAAFPGSAVRVTSQTDDGKLALVQVSSDRNPGDFYVVDSNTNNASFLLSRRDWFDPDEMATMTPLTIEARDGLVLHGYLTTPAGSNDKVLPLVVMPHGGPFGIRDDWGFDTEVQMLARSGYAVLQVNFRGSGGYGSAFEHAGARQWGLTMQDDLTDATRWAVKEGVADANRMCIYGASYGGYAALMGVAKEASLYRCAVGYVGVYDLPTMHTHGDIQRRGSGETYLRSWIGEGKELLPVSPSKLASQIKVPVFLAAGGEDERAPIEHSRMMERALRQAGVPVQTLYFDTEGHGFYEDAHQREYYTQLLAFLAKHLGGQSPDDAGPQPGAKAK